MPTGPDFGLGRDVPGLHLSGTPVPVSTVYFQNHYLSGKNNPLYIDWSQHKCPYFCLYRLLVPKAS